MNKINIYRDNELFFEGDIDAIFNITNVDGPCPFADEDIFFAQVEQEARAGMKFMMFEGVQYRWEIDYRVNTPKGA